jgi:hypothetical protein
MTLSLSFAVGPHDDGDGWIVEVLSLFFDEGSNRVDGVVVVFDGVVVVFDGVVVVFDGVCEGIRDSFRDSFTAPWFVAAYLSMILKNDDAPKLFGGTGICGGGSSWRFGRGMPAVSVKCSLSTSSPPRRGGNWHKKMNRVVSSAKTTPQDDTYVSFFTYPT